VIYEHNKQLQLLSAEISAAHDVWSTLSDEGKAEFSFEYAANLGASLCFLKQPAFSEEKEIRMVHLVNVNIKDGKVSLSDPGGTNVKGKNIKPEKIQYRVTDGLIVPHIDFSFPKPISRSIVEVLLGPKNQNFPAQISMLLAAHGYEEVQIKNSRASYR